MGQSGFGSIDVEDVTMEELLLVSSVVRCKETHIVIQLEYPYENHLNRRPWTGFARFRCSCAGRSGARHNGQQNDNSRTE